VPEEEEFGMAGEDHVVVDVDGLASAKEKAVSHVFHTPHLSLLPYLQEEAAMAAAEVTFILESTRGRAHQFAIAPDSPATPQHELSPQ
jgi:hypothetical protein